MRTLLFCALGALALSITGTAPARGQSPSQSQVPAAGPQAPAASPQAAPQQPKPAPPAKKVWTNDDIDALREHGGNGVSVVGGAAPAARGATANGAHTPGTRANQPPPPLPKEKDPAWYKKQLAPLYAKRDALDAEIANAEAAVSGDTRGSATVDMSAFGSAATPQEQLKQLQDQQQQVENQIDALEDMARHNGLEPGSLR
jgi:hypothetical protein